MGVPCLRTSTADWYKTSMMAASPHDSSARSTNAGSDVIKFTGLCGRASLVAGFACAPRIRSHIVGRAAFSYRKTCQKYSSLENRLSRSLMPRRGISVQIYSNGLWHSAEAVWSNSIPQCSTRHRRFMARTRFNPQFGCRIT